MAAKERNAVLDRQMSFQQALGAQRAGRGEFFNDAERERIGAGASGWAIVALFSGMLGLGPVGLIAGRLRCVGSACRCGSGRSGWRSAPCRPRRLLTELATGEQGREDGVAYLYLPRDGGDMQLARLRVLDTEDAGDLPHGPLAPVEDVHDAHLLGPAVRSVLAGRADEDTADLLVTVVYRWTVDWLTVVLSLATLDPGGAVAMVPVLDDFADTVWVEDGTGQLVRADPVAVAVAGEGGVDGDG